MKLRRILSCMMALLLAVGMPLAALAGEYDLANGSIEIYAPAEGGQTVAQGGGTPVADSAPVITQSGGGTTTNTVTITAESGATAEVTLDGVNIDTKSTGQAAIQTTGAGNVTIELDGSNTVQSGYLHAGVEKNNGGNLTITDDNGTDGSLNATGGTNGAGIGGGDHGAGIGGGGVLGEGNNITITGGEVTAQGGMNGAGIGGGDIGDGSNITITGGTVTANGGMRGAGIGGGALGDGSNITISGGEVTANGGYYAAGVGGGDVGDGSNITISGGEVTAQGGMNGAGIGGGDWGDGSNISIKNGAVVTAEGKNNAADIGDGRSKDSTGKQPDNVDVSGLYTTGSVNGVPGTVEPPTQPVVFDGLNETDFWQKVVRQIQAANPGDTITIDASGLFTIPYWVIDAVVEQGVTLVIQWTGGEDIVIDHRPDTGDQIIWVFSFTTLPQLLAK